MDVEKTTAAAPASESSPAAAAPPEFLTRTFQAFRYRDFRLMWAGAFTSTTGTWMQSVAQAWLVLEMTGPRSAFFLGLLGFLGDLPIMLFSLVGGVVADRIDRRRILLGSQYVQMTCAFILTLLVYFNAVHIWHMMVLVTVAGTAMSFGGPAYQALIPGLVERRDVPNAVALNSIQFNLARVVGPLIAGITMAGLGAGPCFFLNGLSFLAVIAGLYMIRATFQPQKTTQSVLEGIGSGFSFIRKRGSLWQLTVLGFISSFCSIPLLTLLPVVAKDTFHLDARGYSYLVSISGIGSILRGADICGAGAAQESRTAGVASATGVRRAAGRLRRFALPSARLPLPVFLRHVPDYTVCFHQFARADDGHRGDARTRDEHLHDVVPGRDAAGKPGGRILCVEVLSLPRCCLHSGVYWRRPPWRFWFPTAGSRSFSPHYA